MEEDKKNEMDYASYVAMVYEKMHREQKMGTTAFGRQIFQFQKGSKATDIKVKSYGRGAVNAWLKEKKHPDLGRVESLVCIALLDYCGNTDAVPHLTMEKREQRLKFVTEKLWKYLNKKLYSRHPVEALLMQAARGIISVSAIPDELKRMELEKNKLRKEEVKTIARKANTDNMNEEIRTVKSVSEMQRVIDRNKEYYAVGYKTLGVRIRDLWETQHPELSFPYALSVYAPKQQNTYQKMKDNDLHVSREFIIQFCSQMNFSRELINLALRTAQMKLLEEKEGIPDYFSMIKELPLEKRFAYLVYFVSYLEAGRRNPDTISGLCPFPPACYLAHYVSHEDVKSEFQEMEKALWEDAEGFVEDIETGDASWVSEMETFIFNRKEEMKKWEEAELEDYERYCETFRLMYEPYPKKMEKLPEALKKEADCLYVLSTYSYAVLLEKEYKGELLPEDLEKLETLIMGAPVIREEEKESIYFFFNTLWALYLDAGEILADAKGNLYGMRGEPLVKTRSFGWTDALESILECWAYSLGMDGLF